MKLISLEVTPRGQKGWHSGKHDLDHQIIVFQASNGAGKTPLLKCLVYGLGHYIELPREIQDKCQFIKIEVLSSGVRFMIIREIDSAFRIGVDNFSDGTHKSFDKETEYSEWFSSLLGLTQIDLTTVARVKGSLYSNLLIPMFWIDQDRGWNKTYFSEKNFIWDQEEELTRLFLNLPIRHPFAQRENFETAKAELAAIESRLEINNRAMAQEKRDLGETADSSVEIYEKEIRQIQTRLETISDDLSSSKRIGAVFDDRIHELKRELSKIASERTSLEETQQRFSSVESELNGEIELLGTNVSAAKAFRSFCGNEKCKLFSQSEASYGKRLLYLADQVKDVGREVIGLAAKIRTLKLHETDIVTQVKQLETSRNSALEKAGEEQPVTLLKSMISRLTELERTKGRIEKYASLKSEFGRLYGDKERQKGIVDSLSPARTNRGAGQVRTLLTEAFTSWLSILGTRALPTPISFDDNLKINFDDQGITGFSGSTLLRILLSYRTALYQVSKSVHGGHPGILIMDAPRQHEIKVEDFSNYFQNVYKKLSAITEGLQVIISLSDEIFPTEVPHAKIEPNHLQDGQLKYFGPTA